MCFGSGSALTKLSRIRNRIDPNPGETIFGVKILKFFDKDPDPGSGIFLNWDPGWKKFGSGINILDPQHWLKIKTIQKLRFSWNISIKTSRKICFWHS
jgi:hypothetical protein